MSVIESLIGAAATSRLGALPTDEAAQRQVTAYLKDPVLNPSGKAVVLYAPNYTRNAEREIIKAGGHIVRSEQELRDVLKLLGKE